MAFLNLHGIEVEKNEGRAKALFLRAAQLGDPTANYMCYCLKLQQKIGELFDLELLSDYKAFAKNVLYNMDVHEEEDKSFIIKKMKNI